MCTCAWTDSGYCYDETCECSCHGAAKLYSEQFRPAWYSVLLNDLSISKNDFYAEIETVSCPLCGESIYNAMLGASINHSSRFNLITFLKHLRNDSAMSLRDAKDLAELFVLNESIRFVIKQQVAEFKQLKIKQLEDQAAELNLQLVKLKSN